MTIHLDMSRHIWLVMTFLRLQYFEYKNIYGKNTRDFKKLIK